MCAYITACVGQEQHRCDSNPKLRHHLEHSIGRDPILTQKAFQSGRRIRSHHDEAVMPLVGDFTEFRIELRARLAVGTLLVKRQNERTGRTNDL